MRTKRLDFKIRHKYEGIYRALNKLQSNERLVVNCGEDINTAYSYFLKYPSGYKMVKDGATLIFTNE